MVNVIRQKETLKKRLEFIYNNYFKRFITFYILKMVSH